MSPDPEAPDETTAGGAGPSEAHDDGVSASSLGAYIRAQRQLANLSLRQLSTMTEVSNAYLSQIERGLHEPSMRVIKSVSDALGLAPESLLSVAGLIPDDPGDDDPSDGEPPVVSTEEAILADPHLSDDEKQALISVYRSYRGPAT